MPMSKKDFDAIAGIFRKEAELTWLEPATLHRIQDKLADYFKSQNGLFDRQRFHYACDPASVASKKGERK